MAPLMHILNHIHIPLGEDIVGIVGPLKKVGGRKVHGKL